MGLLDRFKKKEETKPVITLSINELKEKVKKELLKNNNITLFTNEISKLINQADHVNKSSNELLNARPSQESSKALIIGVNNVRRTLCTTVNQQLKKPNTLKELSDYMNSLNKLLINSNEALSKYGNSVSMIYRNELNNLSNNLSELRDEFMQSSSKIKPLIELINSLNETSELISNHERLKNEIIKLRNQEENNKSQINKLNQSINELNDEINELSDDEELNDSLINESLINSEMNEIKNQANNLISDLSRLIRKFSHGNNNKFLNELMNNPLNALNDSENEFIKLRESLIKELNTGLIELKDNKIMQKLIDSEELINLSKKNKELVSNLKNLDLSKIKEKNSKEEEKNKLLNEKESLINKNKQLSEEIILLNNKINDHHKILEKKASQALTQEIKIN